jgi:hypothetical protein
VTIKSTTRNTKKNLQHLFLELTQTKI